MNNETENPSLIRFRVLPAVLFAAANALFVLKYGERATGHAGWCVAAYVLFAGALLFFAPGRLRAAGKFPQPFFFLAAIIALGFVYAMKRVDPYTLNVDRWSAITAFDKSLLSGSFPYAARSHLGQPASGFPGLFLLMLPFYLLGDAGYFQIFSFLAFSVLIWKREMDSGKKAALLLLAGTSPMFFWECAARSELFGNMTLLLLALFWTESKKEKFSSGTAVIAGVLAGLVLSTRGVTVIPLLVYFVSFLRSFGWRRRAAFVLALAVTAAAIFLPFYLWDRAAFSGNNPFLLQAGYIPAGLLIPALVAAAVAGFFARNWDRFLSASGYILFAVIGAVFFLSIREMGLSRAVLLSGFDLSYFQFAAPFLLLFLFPSDGTSHSPENSAVSRAEGIRRS
jgi:hypothetical protein